MRHSIIVFISFLGLSCFGATYYVSTNGNDAVDGSSGTPWLTVSNGLSHLAPGVTLKLTSGQTFYETNLWINQSGTIASPILVTTTESGRAKLSVIQGCGISITNSSWLTIDNLEIVGNVTNRANVDETPCPTNAAGVLYIPWNASSSTNFTVQNCIAHRWGVGIHVWGNNTAINYNTTIASNFIYDCTYVGIIAKQDQNAGWITNISVAGNTISNILGDYGGAGGIFMKRNRSATVNSNLVTKIKNDPAVSSSPSVGIEFDYNGPCTAIGNEISEVRAVSHSGDAIAMDFDYSSHDMLAERNYVRNCDGSAFQGYICTSNNVWRFNVAINCAAGTGSPGMLYLVNPSSVISNSAVYNNTFISLSNGVPGVVIGASSTYAGTNLFANNIIITTNAPSFYIPASMTNSFLLSGNDYYDLGRAVQMYWNGATYHVLGRLDEYDQTGSGHWLDQQPSFEQPHHRHQQQRANNPEHHELSADQAKPAGWRGVESQLAIWFHYACD